MESVEQSYLNPVTAELQPSHSEIIDRFSVFQTLLDGHSHNDETTDIILSELLPEAATVSEEWFEAAADNLQDLLELEAGWSGPSSVRVNRASLAALLAIVSSVDVPTNVPLQFEAIQSGGVQVSWHTSAGSIEFGVDNEGEALGVADVPGQDMITIFDIKTLTEISDEELEHLQQWLTATAQLRP